jgi:hypothetical protein
MIHSWNDAWCWDEIIIYMGVIKTSSFDVYRNDLNKFYKRTVDIIYAFIIGQSFLQLDSLLVPVPNVFEYHRFIDEAALFLAYFITVFGWITYHKSITYRPHIGRLGNARYTVDLFILFLTYYILRLANPDGKAPYGQTFTIFIPLLFLVYTIWDAIKLFEYRSKDKMILVNKKGFMTTLLYGVFFILLGYVYLNLLNALPITPQNFWGNKTTVDIYFIIAALVLTAGYRLAKWDVKSEIPP